MFSTKKQLSVSILLIIALSRVGCDGNGSSVDRICCFSWHQCSSRLFVAILSLKDRAFHCCAEERKEVSARFHITHGLRVAVGVGVVDGT